MKRSIRTRFFAWLSVQTALVFLAIGTVLFVFNFHERLEHPAFAEEEFEEWLVIEGVMALLFPIALGMAWYISRRLLSPWQQLVVKAERISSGHLNERIDILEPIDEIGRLGATLNATFDNYQTLVDRLHRFSYDASHQLRNPLAAIRASGEICLTRPRSSEEYISVIGGILENVTRLSRTVEQLLMLARTVPSALDEQREEFSLCELIEDVLQEARAVGESRSLSIECPQPEQPLTINGVKELIREALANLIDNALTFTPDGGQIVVTVEKRSNRRIRMTVMDSGPGLTSEQKATLFQPFKRDLAGRKESVGLGLAIVADICHAHFGEVGIEDNPKGGSIFWMELPSTEPR